MVRREISGSSISVFDLPIGYLNARKSAAPVRMMTSNLCKIGLRKVASNGVATAAMGGIKMNLKNMCRGVSGAAE